MKKIKYMAMVLFYFMLNNTSYALEPNIVENQTNVSIKPEIFLGVLNTIQMNAMTLSNGSESALDVSAACTRVSEYNIEALIDRSSFCQKIITDSFYITDGENSNNVIITTYVYSDNNSVYGYNWPLKVRYRTFYSNPLGPKVQISPDVSCGLERCKSSPVIPITLQSGLSPELSVNVILDMETSNLDESSYWLGEVEHPKGSVREFILYVKSIYNMVGEAGYSYTNEGMIPELRCDNGRARSDSKGCVFHDAPAVLRTIYEGNPDTLVKQSAEHIKEAQNSGLPGRYEPSENSIMPIDNFNNALTRQKDIRLINTNRRNSTKLCKAVDVSFSDECQTPEGTLDTLVGCQCDEYPFASTRQGGLNAPSPGVSTKMIKGGDNEAAGRLLGTFYLQQRVLDGEAFYVNVE